MEASTAAARERLIIGVQRGGAGTSDSTCCPPTREGDEEARENHRRTPVTNEYLPLSPHAADKGARVKGLRWAWMFPSGDPLAHLLAVVDGVDGVVEAGLVGQPQRLLEEVFGVVLEDGAEGEVGQLRVLLVAVVAEVDEVLDVVVGADEIDVLGGGEIWVSTSSGSPHGPTLGGGPGRVKLDLPPRFW